MEVAAGEGEGVKAKKYTKAEWKKAFEWGRYFFGLNDWYWDLDWSTWPPPCKLDCQDLAFTRSIQEDKRAQTWIDVKGTLGFGLDPLQVLFHEMEHVALEDAGVESDSPPMEFLLKRLEVAVLREYRYGATLDQLRALHKGRQV